MTRSLPLLCLALALALAAPAAAKTSKKDVQNAFKTGDKDKVLAVLKEVAGSLDRDLVKAVVENAKRLRSIGVYEDLVQALSTASGDALDELIKEYKKVKKDGALRFLVLDSLGGAKDERAEALLVEAATKDKDEPIRVLAIRQLGKRATKSAVEALIPFLGELEKAKTESERLIREVNGALQNLTGGDLSVAEDWRNWWEQNKDKFTPKQEEGKTAERGNVLDRMAKERPADLKSITRIKDGELIVVRGNDKVEDVLDALKLKHKRIKRDELEKLDLDPQSQILLLNCPGREAFSDAGVQKVRDFVVKGGYVFCSDWELGKTLAKAFPEACQFLKEAPKGDVKDVTIVPFPESASHPLMRDVFPLNTFETGGFAWKLEGRSHLAKQTPQIVPLVSCPAIKDQGTTMVAFCFAYADLKGAARPVTGGDMKKLKQPPGQVLWVSSHFKLQKDPKSDGFALQQLLLNFIVEKQEQRRKFAAR
ncbi:MAG: HEAT repeat domain-containing protein [Planctomycetota bacterium]